jgi:hypothetical protein
VTRLRKNTAVATVEVHADRHDLRVGRVACGYAEIGGELCFCYSVAADGKLRLASRR